MKKGLFSEPFLFLQWHIQLRHDPEKWIPVFRKHALGLDPRDHAQSINKSMPASDYIANALSFFDLTRFFHATRCPSTGQVRGHASLENALDWLLRAGSLIDFTIAL
jgi:hypothetical protein